MTRSSVELVTVQFDLTGVTRLIQPLLFASSWSRDLHEAEKIIKMTVHYYP